MRYFNEVVLSAVDGTVVNTSEPIPATNLFAVSAQITSAGTPTSVVKFQASNDPMTVNGKTNPPSNWADIPSATVTLATAGTVLIPKFDICYTWIRVTQAVGTAATITVSVKALGA